MKTQNNASAPAVGAHTPGPWESLTSPTGLSYITPSGSEKILARVARLDDGINNEARDLESQANASLIAAAPELLAALRRVIEIVDAGENFSNEAFFGTEQNQIRELIAQADGRS